MAKRKEKAMLPKFDGPKRHFGCLIPLYVKSAFLDLLGVIGGQKGAEITRLFKVYLRAADEAAKAGVDVRHNPPEIKIVFNKTS